MVKIKTNLCYSIFESCNGAQEVEGRASTVNGGTDFGAGLTGERIFGSDPLPLQYAKAIKSLKKERVMNPLLMVAIPLGLVIVGMVLNSIGLSFDQPPSSAEQDPAKRAAAEGEAYRRFFDLQRSRAVTRQKRIGQYAWLLMVAIIGSFIWLYMYTVKKTTAATQIAALQTLAKEEGKEMVLSVTLKDGSNVKYLIKHTPIPWMPPRKKGFRNRRSHPTTWNNQVRS